MNEVLQQIVSDPMELDPTAEYEAVVAKTEGYANADQYAEDNPDVFLGFCDQGIKHFTNELYDPKGVMNWAEYKEWAFAEYQIKHQD